MKKFFFPFLAAFILVTACQKEMSLDNQFPGIGSEKFPPTPITGSVAGIVLNENNEPVANANVWIGTQSLTTDSRGWFNSGDLTLDKYITTVKVEVNGYHTAYRSFSANETKNYVSIKLIPKDHAGTFSSNGAGLVNLPNGSSLSFQANSVVLKGTNTPYTGTVNVYASYIDPDAVDFGSTVPGSLMAEDATRFYVLRSTGMIAVEMEGAGGEPLQLTTGKPATVKLAIPSSLLGVAPTTIDTWSLDERGIWMKEGMASRAGNAYEFEATHFSFWNCDVPTTAVHLDINVKDNSGNILINQLVSLTSTTTFGTTWGVTDNAGNVSGMIPANENLIFKAYPTVSCSTSPYYSQNIGSFTSNSVYNILVNQTPPNSYQVTGTALDCMGNPLQNGEAIIFDGFRYYYRQIHQGTFSIVISTCDPLTSITARVIDYNLNMDNSFTIPVTGNQIALGSLSSCNLANVQSVSYSLDGNSITIADYDTYSSLYAGVINGKTIISAQTYNSSGHRLMFEIAGSSQGTFQIGSPDSLKINSFQNPIALSGASATIISMGQSGEYVEGNFNIPFEATGTVHSLTGTFRVKRIQ